MEHEPTMRSDRRAHAAQAGLAALVGGSLLAFSLIAFHTGLTSDTGPGVKAERPNAGTARPVVLPASPAPVAAEQAAGDDGAALVATRGPIDAASDDDDAVLGTQEFLADSQTAPDPIASLTWRAASEDEEKAKPSKVKQTGHEKARGKGHHKNDHNGRHDVAASDKKRGHGKSKGAKGKKDRASDGGRSGHGRQDEPKSRGRSGRQDEPKSRGRSGHGRSDAAASKSRGRSAHPRGANHGGSQGDKSHHDKSHERAPGKGRGKKGR